MPLEGTANIAYGRGSQPIGRFLLTLGEVAEITIRFTYLRSAVSLNSTGPVGRSSSNTPIPADSHDTQRLLRPTVKAIPQCCVVSSWF